ELGTGLIVTTPPCSRPGSRAPLWILLRPGQRRPGRAAGSNSAPSGSRIAPSGMRERPPRGRRSDAPSSPSQQLEMPGAADSIATPRCAELLVERPLVGLDRGDRH